MGYMKLHFRLVLLLLSLVVLVFSCGVESYDLVIQNGLIVDGTGSESYTGDIAIQGTRIVKIGSIPMFFALCVKYITYIIIMEWILRVLLSIRLRMKSTSTDMTTQDFQSKNVSGIKV